MLPYDSLIRLLGRFVSRLISHFVNMSVAEHKKHSHFIQKFKPWQLK